MLLGPQALHHGQHLVGPTPPGLHRNADGLEFHPRLALPADADAEVEPPVRDQVDRGDQLGQEDRVVQGRDDDPGHDAQPAGRARGGGRHGQGEIGRTGRVAVHDVLAHGDALEPERFGPWRDLGQVPGIAGRRDTKGQLRLRHVNLSPLADTRPSFSSFARWLRI